VDAVEEEELEVEEEYTDAYLDVEEEEVEVEEANETDPEVSVLLRKWWMTPRIHLNIFFFFFLATLQAVAEDEKTISELESEKNEVDEIYENYEDQYESNAEGYEGQAAEFKTEEEEIVEEEEVTKEEYGEAEAEVEEGMTPEDDAVGTKQAQKDMNAGTTTANSEW